MTRILGIDCGSVLTGYGIIDTDGRCSHIVTWGAVRTAMRRSFPQRLQQISQALQNLIRIHSPNVMAVEGIFYAVNAKSALVLGQVRGVVLLAAAQAGLSVHEYSPLQVKSGIVGYGRAEKSQVQQMVRTLLHLEETPPEDAADALAVALCHAHQLRTLEKISRSSARSPLTAPHPSERPPMRNASARQLNPK